MPRLSLALFLIFLVSCSLSNHGLEEDELHIVMPAKERSNAVSMVIAHQGAWRETNLPGNSLAAFQAALAMNIYGSECDVRQTKDGCLVACHDATYSGYSIAETDYATLAEHPLDNGEPLPLLDNFLDALSKDKGEVRLVLDLKECGTAKMLNLIYSYGVLDRVDFLTGNSRIANYLMKYGFGYKTFFLGGGLKPQSAQKKGYGGISYSKQVFTEHPEWIAEAQTLGLKTWVWTVNDEKSMLTYLQQGVMVTTDKPELAMKITIPDPPKVSGRTTQP